MTDNQTEAYYSELKKIGARIKRFVEKINEELMTMNCGISIGISAGAISYDSVEWSTDDWRELTEDMLGEQEALGVWTEIVDEMILELWFRERKEKES